MGFKSSLAVSLKAALMAGWVSCIAWQAQAASVTYDVTYPQWPGAVEAGAGPLSVIWPQFDPSLGTLTGVTYDVTGTMAFTLTNNNAAPSSLVYYAFSVGLTGNGTGLTYKSPSQTASQDQIYDWSVMDGPSTVQPGATTRDFTVDFQRTPDLGLTPFIGLGVIDFNLSLSKDISCYSLDGSGGYGCNYGGSGGANVTYDYVPSDPTLDGSGDPSSVPTPASAALLITGLGLSGLTRRRTAR